MGIVSMGPAGSAGINVDVSPAELAPEYWTAGGNIQFANGAARSVADPSVLLSSTPLQFHSALPGPVSSLGYASWLLGGNTDVYAYIKGVSAKVTRAAGVYAGAAGNRWSGGALGGVMVINNGVNQPQGWSVAATSQLLVDLPNWQTNVVAACLRPYKQFLVALNITKGTSKYPTLVKWSHPADPGTFPTSWDETDPTKDAGEYPLSETPGHCIDCVPLRDINVIYKQDSVWGMQYIGGQFIFRFTKIFGDFGIPNRDCAVEYQSGKHFVFTGNDLVVHDGQNATSVASGKVRSVLKALDIDQVQAAYVVLNVEAQEVWFCYQRGKASTAAADTAIVYNWVDGSFSFRDLPSYRFIASGRIDPTVSGVDLWDTIADSWEAAKGSWGDAITEPASVKLVGLGELSVDWVDAKAYSTPHCWLERSYLGVPLQATKAPDLSVQKFLTRIWPRITGFTGDTITIQLGTADSPAENISWRDGQPFIIGVTKQLDCTLTGKLFAIRIESENSHQWSLTGLDADIKAQGVL